MPWSKKHLPPAVAGKGWSDEQIEKFIATANAVLEKTGDEGEAIATGIKQAEHKTNAKEYPKVYYARHMQPGIVGYENETILVDTDAIKNMLPSGVGKPVYVHHQDVELDRLKETASGYITDAFYNPHDGWGWFKLILIDDDAHEAARRKWGVSNAYLAKEWKDGGTKNNLPYGRELVNGEFTHLAIVPDPRYENACLYTQQEFDAYQEQQKKNSVELRNSKLKGFKAMFFKNKREEVSKPDNDTMVELKNAKGETEVITYAEYQNRIDAVNKAVSAPKVKLANGEELSPDELNARFHALNAKKNGKKKNEKEESEADEDADEDKENEMDGGDESGSDYGMYEEGMNKRNKKNADDDGEDDDTQRAGKDMKNKKNKKSNSRSDDDEDDRSDGYFHELRNANKNPKPKVQVIDTPATMLARGKQRYGTATN